MPEPLSDEELNDFRAVAERAAAKVSRDREVVGESAFIGDPVSGQ